MEHNFITTSKFNLPGEKPEHQLWQALVRAFSKNICLAYWRYPMFLNMGEKRKEPDILLLDQKLGVVIIEVKGLVIDQITEVTGHRWTYQDFYEDFGNPYEQAENHLYSFEGLLDRNPNLRRRVAGRALVALPNIMHEQWQRKGFDTLPCNPPIVFKDDLNDDRNDDNVQQLIKKIEPVIHGELLDDGKWQILCHTMGATSVLHCQETVTPKNVITKADAIKAAKAHIMAMDIEQEKAAKQIPDGPQRIRGIAGSGKTVLLCQKAAAMHLKHPNWDIALVFFTRSLYDIVIDLVTRYISYFTQGEMTYDPETSRLRILHAWGAKDQPGLYSEVCKQHRVTPLNVKTIGHQGSPTENLVIAASKLLDTLASQGKKLEPMFDAILIDEGQDLVVDDTYKRDGKQPYYWMAYQLCRDISSTYQAGLFKEEDTKTAEKKLPLKRLIWGYDEAQCIESPVIPTAAEIFGKENSALIKGNYQGNVKRSIIMQRCYRTPAPILVAAHAIGMGLLRPEGMISGVTNQQDWNILGYEVEGKFISGQRVKLWRPAKNSPNPLPKISSDPSIEVAYFENRNDEIEDTARRIVSDVYDQGLNPSRQLLVVILGRKKYQNMEMENDIEHLTALLREKDINFFIPSSTQKNTLKPYYPNKNPNLFWFEDAITISDVNRAKGNEAEMVYVIGLDRIARYESSISARNQLFVALTRAKGWVRLTGKQGYKLNTEINAVLHAKGRYDFTFSKKPQYDISDVESSSEWQNET